MERRIVIKGRTRSTVILLRTQHTPVYITIVKYGGEETGQSLY
jgi:hypothetical protein